MGFFKNLRENARMAKYLRTYDTLPPVVKSFFDEKEFIAEISNVWGLQKTYEAIKWPPGWPFNSASEIPGLDEHIKWAKSEGVTDKDIVWWWNLSPLDRIIIKGSDNAFRRAALFEFTNQGLKPEEVMERVKRAFTIYSDIKPDLSSMTPGDKEYFSSEDKVLPIELHDRVDIYLKNNSDSNDLSKMQREKENFTSANAWVRYLLKNGRL